MLHPLILLSNLARNFLNNHFPGKWIGKHGPIPFPSRSPDLTIPDFFYWGEMKRRVYKGDNPNTRDELLQRIETAAEAVTLNRQAIMASTFSVAHQAELCIENNGGHFQQYL